MLPMTRELNIKITGDASGIGRKSTVYILGAGCSSKYGYPLAKEFVTHLESFGKTLGEGAQRLKKCVSETVELMQRAGVHTVDDLAARLHDGNFVTRSGVPARDLQFREERIREAKLVTSAMFLSKEGQANRLGLSSYHDLLREMCVGPGNWQQRLRSSKSRVLSFNYDRLFETATLNLIGDLAEQGIYSSSLLNSGFDVFGDNISFEPQGFSFLKLHGSVGARVGYEHGQQRYYAPMDGLFRPGADIEITDSLFFDDQPNQLRYSPLLVYPHEKHHVEAGGKHEAYEKYLKSVWKKAEEILLEADEIYLIGYSFAAIDRNSVLNLLGKARKCRKFVVQNLPDQAKSICARLAIKYPEIKAEWVPFGEQF